MARASRRSKPVSDHQVCDNAPNLVEADTSRTYSDLDSSLVPLSRIVLYPPSERIVLDMNQALGSPCLALKP